MRGVVLVTGLLFVILAVGRGDGARGSDLPAVHASFGAYRVLVVLATWEPQPFTVQDVQQALGRVDSFFRRSSYGRLWLSVTVTSWLHAFDGPLPCDLPTISGGARTAATAAGYDLEAYDVVVYLHPAVNCPWFGVTATPQIWLNGTISPWVVAHELGHSLGLAHANTMVCAHYSCAALAYGDPYDTMGQGTGDFSAYAKYILGWLTDATDVRRDGVYELDPLELPSAGPQAVVITTAHDQYWLEDRTEPAVSESGARVGDPGVLVHVSASPGLRSVNVALLENVLLVDPARRGRLELRPGDRFVDQGIFSVTVVESGARGARLSFKWHDRVPPSPPRLVALNRIAGRLRVSWGPARETGSGVAYYAVSVDRRRPLRVDGDAANLSVMVRRIVAGVHIVRVVAVDRAGNRGRPALRTVTIPV